MKIDNTNSIFVLMSNDASVLLHKLKENLSASCDPFNKCLIIVPDVHSKSWLAMQLSQELSVLGIEMQSIEQWAKDLSSMTYFDCLASQYRPDTKKARALALAHTQAMKMWYGIESEQNASINNYRDEIHLYGVSALCPFLHRRLLAISQKVKVFYYVLSPCMLFWEDVYSDREAKRLQKSLPESAHDFLYDRSRLLANNASLGREFARILQDSQAQIVEAYVTKEWHALDPVYSQTLRSDAILRTVANPATLLDIIQSDLLLLGPKRETKFTIEMSDSSFQVHKALTIQREVEILFLELQKYSQTVLVLTPDLALYKPYIQGIFGQSCQIIDDAEWEIWPTFRNLFENPDARLFQNRFLRQKLGLDLEDFSKIFPLLHKAHQGLDLISCWIDPKPDGIELTSSEAVALGRCLHALQSIKGHLQRLQDARTLEAWANEFRKLLDEYFFSCDETLLIKEAINELAQSDVGVIDCMHALQLLSACFEERSQNRSQTLFSPIVFASVGAIRLLQRDMICLIGMNEMSLPRSKNRFLRQFGYLFSHKPPFTVGAILRHLCLEAVLSATKRLYVSYQGYSFTERRETEPANFVQELIATVQAISENFHINSHPLQLQGDQSDAALREALPTSVKEKKKAEQLFVHELVQVAKYPIRAYFQQNLGLYLYDQKLAQKPLEFDLLNQQIFPMLKKQAFSLPKDKAHALINETYKQLPPSLQHVAISALHEELEEFYQNASALGIDPRDAMEAEFSLTCRQPQQLESGLWKLPALEVETAQGKVQIAGRLTDLHPEGLFVFAKKSKEAVYKRWPELLLSAHFSKVKPRLLFLQDGKAESFEIKEPEKALREYVQYAFDCRMTPFGLYPDWIDDLCTSPTPVTKSQGFSWSDPYLDLYLSRLDNCALDAAWLTWRKQALALFGEGKR